MDNLDGHPQNKQFLEKLKIPSHTEEGSFPIETANTAIAPS
jgi:hypothetical protein